MGAIPFKELRIEIKKLISNLSLWIKKCKMSEGQKSKIIESKKKSLKLKNEIAPM